MSSISPGPSTSNHSFVLKNVTIDDNDSSLKYSQGWNRSMSSLAIGGSFHIANHVGDLVSFSLPANAVAIYYVGYQQSAGALYEACLDCSTQGTGNANVIDAFNNASRSTAPTLLYEDTNLDPSVLHTFALSNLADARFRNTSTITLDAFIVTVQDEVTSASAPQSIAHGSAASLVMQVSTSSQISSSASLSEEPTSSASRSEQPTSSSALSSEQLTAPSVSSSDQPIRPPAVLGTDTKAIMTATLSFTSASASSSANRGQNDINAGQRLAGQVHSPLALTGIILAVLFVVCTSTFALMYFMRRRRRRSKEPYTQISEQTALFFNAMKKVVSGEHGGSGGRKSMFGFGAGNEGGSSGMDKDVMVENYVQDKFLPYPSHEPYSSQAARLATQQAPAAPYLAYNTVPRSLFRPPGAQRVSCSRLHSSESCSFNYPGSQGIPDGERVKFSEVVTIAVEPTLTKTDVPRTVRRTHPYNNPFVIAEAETRASEHERAPTKLLGHGTHRRDSSSSVGSLYSQGEGVRRNAQPPPPSVARPRTDNAWDS
ncbi:hypothetical protein EW145_g1249 [Phellinidium pouzarii]|uniref:Uncharacterized protein n=1 Tax=Phellinidium pouzarii TaxID=167371 RepID=A0A4S4LFT9_9AGAM|nr:hypothetical protein EW145_g1249 [Phellinidium pouzarii]